MNLSAERRKVRVKFPGAYAYKWGAEYRVLNANAKVHRWVKATLVWVPAVIYDNEAGVQFVRNATDFTQRFTRI